MSNLSSKLFDQVVIVVKHYWKYLLLFSVLIIIDACRDYVLFEVPRDSGYFSIHQYDSNDFWHHAKLIQWAIVLIIIYLFALYKVQWWDSLKMYWQCSKVGKIRTSLFFVIAIVLNWVLHELFLHHIF